MTSFFRTTQERTFQSPLLALCSALFFAMAVSPRARSAPRSSSRMPEVNILGVAVNTDSAKISFAPVSGARDYRIYEESAPIEVKYAGIVHWKEGGKVISQAIPEIEWNGLPPGKPVKLIVEALDAPGPVPPGNLSNAGNEALLPAWNKMPSAMTLLGSNAGMTLDKRFTINGQGDYRSTPRVIARSRPFLARATGKPALPSGPDARQVFFDTFAQGVILPVGPASVRSGIQRYRMKSQGEWEILFQNDDIKHSAPFIMNRHYMDVLFDGGTPGSGNPMHISYGVMAMSPHPVADLREGGILHLTMEVDGHVDGRRWLEFDIVPQGDPITNWEAGKGKVNRSGKVLLCHIDGDSVSLAVRSAMERKGGAAGQYLLGSPGQALYTDGQRPRAGSLVGHGLDNRCRFDLFVSKTRFSVYEDGRRIAEHEIPGGLPFEIAKIYYTHFLYHTANEINDLKQYAPYESYWIQRFSYSDERHWDNMGFEVLPKESDWKALANRIHMPIPAPPEYTQSTSPIARR